MDILDEDKQAGVAHTRREHRRYSYRQNLKLECARATEPPLQLWVFPRDLSCNGIGVLMPEPLTAHSTVVVHLLAQNGTVDQIPGRVIYCKDFDRFWHLVGIKFQSPIDPLQYV